MISLEYCNEVRSGRAQFLAAIEPHRNDLYRFCRSLTRTPWDAEDLAQDTVLKAFAKLSERWLDGIQNPRSYLLRMAANAWIDQCRRHSLESSYEEIPMDRSSSPEVGVDLKDAVLRLSHLLPPRERVALVLSEAFDLSAPEIAAIIESSEGAVKAALHRARARLSGARDTGSPSLLKASPTARARIDAFVAALNRRDLDGVANLLLENASGVVYGCVQEFSREEIKKGSMFYTVNTPDGKPQPIPFPKAERRELFGQDVLVIWSDEKTLDDVMRFKVEEGELGGFISYYFCPTVLEEISRTLGSGFKSHGYGPPKKSS